jgi:cytochrome c553
VVGKLLRDTPGFVEQVFFRIANRRSVRIVSRNPFTMKNSAKFTLASALFCLAAALSYAAPAADNWDAHCAKCHGADGKGQTKVGKKLKLKDYTDAKVQAELKDEEMIKVTAEGVTEKGKERMKAFKDELSAAEIKDLVAHIRKFKG